MRHGGRKPASRGRLLAVGATPEQRKASALAKQRNGSEGVFLVCAELARRGFIVSPTARNAKGADILVTDLDCMRAFTVQVKTNAESPNFWLVDRPERPGSACMIFVLVNLNGHKRPPDFFVVPSADLRAATRLDGNGQWPSFYRDDRYKDNWGLFNAGVNV